MNRAAVALAAMALLLGGCAPDTGVVYDKKYEEAYSYIDSQCTMYDKNGLCKLRIPVVHNVPEHWLLCLRSGDESGCKYVDQITWHEYERGDQYP